MKHFVETRDKIFSMDVIYSNYTPTFLYVDKYHFSAKWVYQGNNIPYSILRYICAGSALFKVNGESYTVQSGDVFYIPQNCSLYCASISDVEFISVRFIGSIQLPSEDMLKYLFGIKQKYNSTETTKIKNLFEQMYQTAISESKSKLLETQGCLNLICSELAKLSTPKTKVRKRNSENDDTKEKNNIKLLERRVVASHANTDPRIRTLVDYIALHPSEKISREKMCKMCDMGESSLRRLFKATMGKTIGDFIFDIKMIYATHLLVTTVDPISEIGYELGFESPSYFTKKFRENFGVSPQAYRRGSKELYLSDYLSDLL